MIAFFLTWLFQFPSAWLHPSKAGPLFVVKSLLSPTAYIVTMIWTVVKFNGVDLQLGKKTVSGSVLAWSFMKAINTVVSGVVPPMVNIADLARYANKPSDAWPLVAGLFISKPLVIIIGLLTTAAGLKEFGVANWNLWDLYTLILENYWSPSTRTLVFLGSFIQAFATIVTNVSSNAIPIGCDLAGLFPNYFTIIRGQILCNLLIWPVVPWLLVNSAKNFITFLGSYLCFITPILACMIVDYWLIRKGNIHIPSLYRPEPGSPYFYHRGFNPRAYAAWAIGVVLVISGIAGSITPGSISQTAVNIYNMGFILSLSAGALSYYIFCRLFPVDIYPSTAAAAEEEVAADHSIPSSWEYMVPTEGFFVDGKDDDVMPEYVREKIGGLRGDILQGVEVEGREHDVVIGGEKDVLKS
ncbi:putative allantoin transport [Phaeomoniella chlamydospora]|uniref:Putative allantoin transport n=1 Tax=Phaeomoniella chlamydospora TaxID=158046 RepID=A0A0G2ET41_PHACM|nr:putative allantoin transport [Phaeomoniella chlamydospora]